LRRASATKRSHNAPGEALAKTLVRQKIMMSPSSPSNCSTTPNEASGKLQTPRVTRARSSQLLNYVPGTAPPLAAPACSKPIPNSVASTPSLVGSPGPNRSHTTVPTTCSPLEAPKMNGSRASSRFDSSPSTSPARVASGMNGSCSNLLLNSNRRTSTPRSERSLAPGTAVESSGINISCSNPHLTSNPRTSTPPSTHSLAPSTGVESSGIKVSCVNPHLTSNPKTSTPPSTYSLASGTGAWNQRLVSMDTARRGDLAMNGPNTPLPSAAASISASTAPVYFRWADPERLMQKLINE